MAVLIRPEERKFYCWRWCRWQPWRRLRYCANQGCRRMEMPAQLSWRAAYVGGLLVRGGVI